MTKSLPKGWRRVRLGEVVTHRPEFITVDDSKTYKRITVQLYNRGICLRDETTGEKLRTKKQRVVRAGDLVVAEIDAKLGGFGIAPSEGEGAIVSSHYFLFTVAQEKCDLGYLDACIRKGILQKQVLAVGSTNYAAVRPSQVLEYSIPLPPLPEQKRIAAALQSVDAAIRANEDVIEKTRGLKKSLANELLTKGFPGRHTRFKDSPIGKVPADWEVKRLGEMCEEIFVGIATSATQAYAERGVPLIRTTNIHPGYLDGDLIYISKEFAQSQKNKVLRKGDVLSARTGYPGTSVVVPPAFDGAQCFTLLVSRPKLPLTPDYLCLFMNSEFGRRLVELGQAGGAQQNLNAGVLSKSYVSCPPKEEQILIVDAVNSIETSTTVLTDYETIREMLRDSLLTGVIGADA